jgi:ABC-2 type transport system ATP-binding protein
MAEISFEKVDKVYSGRNSKDFYALQDLSLVVEEGKVFVLLGPNGSGKTTVINIVNGLLKRTKGTVSVHGMDPAGNNSDIKRLVATVPQETSLYDDLTGKENLEFHADYYGVERSKKKAVMDQVLDLVGLLARQDDRVGTYSGGMQRRLSLARALLTSPDIILLDEPTLGIDVQSRNAIWSRIRQLTQEGKTLFITTNYMEEADALADYLAIIDNGKNVVSGTSRELKDRIGKRQVTLEFRSPQLCDDAMTLLRGRYKVEKTESTMTLALEDRTVLPEVLFILKNHLENLTDLDQYDPTLNDVFLEFTGKNLRD